MRRTRVYVKWSDDWLRRMNTNSSQTMVFLFKAHGAEIFNMLENELMEQRGYAKC